MKRLTKPQTSDIILKAYLYPRDRALILSALDTEQEFYCAYTEECLTPGYARDVEHFDPTLKKTAADGYYNWYSASTRFNRKKGSKARWLKYQPIMYPTDTNLETRLVYSQGDYIASNPKDKEAENLRDFLFLNDMGLPKARVAYINNLKFILQSFNSKTDFVDYLKTKASPVMYRTAIKTEFRIII